MPSIYTGAPHHIYAIQHCVYPNKYWDGEWKMWTIYAHASAYYPGAGNLHLDKTSVPMNGSKPEGTWVDITHIKARPGGWGYYLDGDMLKKVPDEARPIAKLDEHSPMRSIERIRLHFVTAENVAKYGSKVVGVVFKEAQRNYLIQRLQWTLEQYVDDNTFTIKRVRRE